MKQVISVYEARTNLSKYIKQAQAGKTIYVGAYGNPQAVIAPLPSKQPLHIGVWADRKQLGAYDYDTLVGTDPALASEFMSSIEKDL